MEIQHQDDGKKGVHFVNGESGERLAEMTYTWAGSSRLIIDHTHVDDSLRGKGVGRQLLDATVSFAREKQLRILATCPYAKAQLEKHRDTYGDVYDG